MKDGWFRRRYLWYLKRHEVLKTHEKRTGQCARCGHCCGHCIFHDAKNGRCRVYRWRPEICRVFPLTPEDIKKIKTCGFRFQQDENAPAK